MRPHPINVLHMTGCDSNVQIIKTQTETTYGDHCLVKNESKEVHRYGVGRGSKFRLFTFGSSREANYKVSIEKKIVEGLV